MASDAMSSVPSILRFVIECLLWESLLAEYVLQAFSAAEATIDLVNGKSRT